MPSFKSCLVSLALAAFAFAPISASTSTDASLAARGHKEARFVKPSAALARRNAAAKALKKRAGRMSFAQMQAAAKAAAAAKNVEATTTPASSSGLGAYTPGSTFLSTPEAIAASKIRCGAARTCQITAPAPPANGISICFNGRCSYRCNTGFAPSGTECVAASSSCGPSTCATIQNGYATCAGDTCVYGCTQGYTLFTLGGQAQCINLQTDTQNCGTQGNVCPASYNGVGAATCSFGSCRLACPINTYQRRAQSDSNPFYCYGL
ncbi:hypothetical protein BMF94_5815 [Rhodotorula taiwanensis]|uniref:Uncharacterized protein n=1 Tax=Rhodotorula taiwanensis TaxID=741276 RepID=A0A2S5B3Z3_9BASI|nr:hypothetical protein BMF94_5815 [Rhodotorula taiwanensis]